MVAHRESEVTCTFGQFRDEDQHPGLLAGGECTRQGGREEGRRIKTLHQNSWEAASLDMSSVIFPGFGPTEAVRFRGTGGNHGLGCVRRLLFRRNISCERHSALRMRRDGAQVPVAIRFAAVGSALG